MLKKKHYSKCQQSIQFSHFSQFHHVTKKKLSEIPIEIFNTDLNHSLTSLKCQNQKNLSILSMNHDKHANHITITNKFK